MGKKWDGEEAADGKLLQYIKDTEKQIRPIHIFINRVL